MKSERGGARCACTGCVCSAKKFSVPERTGSFGPDSWIQSLTRCLSKPFAVAPRGFGLPQTLTTFETSRDLEQKWWWGNFLLPTTAVLCMGECTGCTALQACRRVYGGSCTPLLLPFPLFPRGSPSPRRPGAARVGEQGGELPACTLSSRPGPGSRLRVLLQPACRQAGELEGRSLAGGAEPRRRRPHRPRGCHWLAAPSRGGGGHRGGRWPRPRWEPGRGARCPPPSCTDMTQTHSHCSC